MTEPTNQYAPPPSRAPSEGVTCCPRCSMRVVVVYDPPVVIETSALPRPLWPSQSEPVHRQHDSGRCRAVRAERRRHNEEDA